MKEGTRKLVQKADRAVVAARMLKTNGDLDFSAGRAYYAMFYAVQALLAEEGIQSRKHGGVHAAFGEYFAKTGRIDAKYHRWILDAFDLRLKGDYEFDALLILPDVDEIILHASELIAAARALLGE